jgi:acyl-CoA thioesterase-2
MKTFDDHGARWLDAPGSPGHATMAAVSRSLAGLIELLDLEVLEVNVFRGSSPETSMQRVFGGQVAGQALMAAGLTVEDSRPVHSLHAYFLRPGDPMIPIVYQVERPRDGRSFSTRRVVAIQHGRPIFTMSASFQVREPGLDHQDPIPTAPDPQSLPTIEERLAASAVPWPQFWREFSSLDVRHVVRTPEGAPGAPETADSAAHVHSQVWLRTAAPLPDDPLLHVSVLAYASDLTLLYSSLAPHRLDATPPIQMASLDHAMWFHRPFRADGWLLYDQHSPSASGARGFATGRLFSQAGSLVASVVQEGLIRPISR